MKHCPVCQEMELTPVLTRQGVEVDLCSQCEGIGLDKDLIFYFTKFPDYWQKKITEAQLKHAPLDWVEFGVKIQYDPPSGRIWLDKESIKKFSLDKLKINVDKQFYFDGEFEGVTQDAYMPNSRIGLLPLPNLLLSSMVSLAGLYGVAILFSWLPVVLLRMPVLAIFPLGILVLILQLLFSPAWMDVLLKTFYQVDWTDIAILEKNYPQWILFLRETCQSKGISLPRIGVIPDGSPQSFIYGNHSNNSRLIVSEGLLDLLNSDEINAVTAHEIGHAVLGDMVLMTSGQLVPLVFNYWYLNLTQGRPVQDKYAAGRYAAATAAYGVSALSSSVILWSSRVREYSADRFAAELTGHPEKLCSALVKVGYGQSGRITGHKKNSRSENFQAVSVLGIFDREQALSLTAVSTLKHLSKWDFWNPWAMYYELFSTHPLLAKRVRLLNNLSEYLGKEPYVRLDDKRPESFWVNFIFELMMNLAPVVCIVLVVILGILGLEHQGIHGLGLVIAALGLGYFIKILMAYPSVDFLSMNIHALLKKIKVSYVRPVACRIRGRIAGQGASTALDSENLLIHDETGMMLVDYEPLLTYWDRFIGLYKEKNIFDKEVEIFGWYRRSPVPYIEIREVRDNNGRYKCYIYDVKFYCAIFLMFIGLLISMIF
ncbi:MAG: M48 family metalloprotease [Candidatus Omnitrophica bacterium]|nr:M48 family metalloprotease [Candidatus Omnitrophota bacterium]